MRNFLTYTDPIGTEVKFYSNDQDILLITSGELKSEIFHLIKKTLSKPHFIFQNKINVGERVYLLPLSIKAKSYFWVQVEFVNEEWKLSAFNLESSNERFLLWYNTWDFHYFKEEGK